MKAAFANARAVFLMKTRIIHTDIHFQDDWFNTLSIGYRYLYIYLFTNTYIGQTGAYKISERIILLETGATKEQWHEARAEFEKSGKVKFIGEYIIVLNARKNSDYSGPKNVNAYRKELLSLPREIQDTLSIPYAYTSDTTINHKSKIINHKSGVQNPKLKQLVEQSHRLIGKDIKDISKKGGRV